MSQYIYTIPLSYLRTGTRFLAVCQHSGLEMQALLAKAAMDGRDVSDRYGFRVGSTAHREDAGKDYVNVQFLEFLESYSDKPGEAGKRLNDTIRRSMGWYALVNAEAYTQYNIDKAHNDRGAEAFQSEAKIKVLQERVSVLETELAAFKKNNATVTVVQNITAPTLTESKPKSKPTGKRGRPTQSASEYFESILTSWLAEDDYIVRLDKGNNNRRVLASRAYRSYRDWSDAANRGPALSAATFARTLVRMGYGHRKIGSRNYITGMSAKDPKKKK